MLHYKDFQNWPEEIKLKELHTVARFAKSGFDQSVSKEDYRELVRYTDALITELTGLTDKSIDGRAENLQQVRALVAACIERRVIIINSPIVAAHEGDPKPGCWSAECGDELACLGYEGNDGDPAKECRECWYQSSNIDERGKA
ncbi:hypothetical protein SDC9_98949 [bioreactor metagenome]|uniref:Uncharacterized protein n=1 Tax=bioreactor metagenome TaxID=1076179 RepID=A0A645AMW8_9ZZZZ